MNCYYCNNSLDGVEQLDDGYYSRHIDCNADNEKDKVRLGQDVNYNSAYWRILMSIL